MNKLIDYHKTNFPAYDIDLAAPPKERWRQVADLEAENISGILDDVVDLLANSPKLEILLRLPVMRTMLLGGGDLGGRAAAWFAGMFGGEYVYEIKGIAKYSGLPLGHLFLANIIYDLTQKLNFSGFGCSSFSCVIDGSPALNRTMDWSIPDSVGLHTRVFRFHSKTHSYESVGVLGCVGIVSAFLPGAWAVTLNQAPASTSMFSFTQWPVMHRIRAVCDASASYRKLKVGLQEYQTMSPFFAHTVGIRPSEQCVITGLQKTFQCRTPRKAGHLVQTNHHLDPALKEYNPQEGIVLQKGDKNQDEPYYYYWDTYRRHDILQRKLDRGQCGDLTKAFAALHHPEVTKEDTQHRLQYQPATSHSRIQIKAREKRAGDILRLADP